MKDGYSLISSWQKTCCTHVLESFYEHIKEHYKTHFNKMNKHSVLLGILKKPKPKTIEFLRNIHIVQGLNQRLHLNYDSNLTPDQALFYTNLPHEKRQKKAKPVKGPIPSGELRIKCKNEALNHYSGMQYGKFDEVPLVSKGWHHKKSSRDYFIILPSKMHPAFITVQNLPITFKENGISQKLIQQLEKINVSHPTVIQAKAIPKLLKGENVFITGECGSGKTLAYVIALIENVLKWKNNIAESLNIANAPIGIVLLPTRELALQVGVLASKLGSDLGVKCHTLVGGDIKNLLRNPERVSVDILTCTLRALQKHLKARIFSTKFCKHLVLDESDTLLDDGFIAELKHLISTSDLNFTGFTGTKSAVTMKSAQICFVCATVPQNIEESLSDIIQDKIQRISTSYLHKPLSNARQEFKRVNKTEKPEKLLQIVKRNIKLKIPTMIFCNRITTTHWLHKFLNDNKIECGVIGTHVFAEDRLKNHRDFEAGITNVVVCTDVASRGLDFRSVRQVINYEFPTFMIDYIHRCGRTGRIGQGDDCVVTNFISGKHELFLLQKIEMAVRTNSPLPYIYQNRIRRSKSS